MAPSIDDVNEYIVDLIGKHPGHLWFFSPLVDRVRRYFQSTTPAISSRMDTLVQKDQLVRIRVDFSGLVFWDNSQMETGYLVPYQLNSYDTVERGEVTWKRPANQDNLWANGVRYMYTTSDEFARLTELFTREKTRRYEATHERRKREKKNFRAAVREVTPDGLELLRTFQSMLTESSVNGYMSTVNDSYEDKTPHPMIQLTVKHQDLETFLSVLRCGVVVKDFAERNGVQS